MEPIDTRRAEDDRDGDWEGGMGRKTMKGEWVLLRRTMEEEEIVDSSCVAVW